MKNVDSLLRETETFVPSAPTANGSTTDRARANHEPADSGQRRGRVSLRYVAFVIVGLAVVVAASLYDPRKLFDGADSTPVASVRDTSVANVTDLTAAHTADGSLVFSDTTTATHRGEPGIVTEIFSATTRIEQGQVLWRVNNEPTVAFFGTIPPYRDLGVDHVGPDVAQLEANLVALGYDPDETVTIDETFTSNTALMVERWQADIDATVTGAVPASALVVIDGQARAGVVVATVGTSIVADAPVLSISSLTRVVQFNVEASERGSLAVGDSITAQFPDRSVVSATVTEAVILDDGNVAMVARSSAAIDYLVDSVPLTISWEVPSGSNVLTVPAAALLRTDAGGYVVEVVQSDATTRFVSVEPGRSSGSLVEVTGDISEGDTVIAP